MMASARTSGFMLIFLALAALSWDVMPLLQGGAFELSTWGDLWYGIHPDSLHSYKVVVEQYISADLWDKVLAPMLLFKAVFVFAFPAATMAILPFMGNIFSAIVDGSIVS